MGRSRKTSGDDGADPGGDLATFTPEFLLLMQSISPEERQAIATLFESHSLRTYDGFHNFCLSVMTLVMAGRVPLPVSVEVRRWAELAFTALTYATDKYNKGAQNQMNIVALVQQAKAAAAERPSRPELPQRIDDPLEGLRVRDPQHVVEAS